MRCSIKRRIIQLAPVRLHVLVVLSLLVLAMVGRVPDSEGGWLTCPPQAVIGVSARRGRVCKGPAQRHDATCGLHLFHTWYLPLIRSLLLWALWHLSGQVGPVWVRMVPWVLGLWQGVGLLWPWLGCQPEWQGVSWLLWQGQRLLMVSYLGLGMGALLRFVGEAASRLSVTEGVDGGPVPMVMGLGCLVCGREEPWVEVVRQEDGGYQVTLCGHFTAGVPGDASFRVWMLMLFLRLLEGPGPQRGGGWRRFTTTCRSKGWRSVGDRYGKPPSKVGGLSCARS